MHYHNATCFGYIRPSSGNTFMRSLMHCALIKYRSFSYIVDDFFTSTTGFIWLSIGLIMGLFEGTNGPSDIVPHLHLLIPRGPLL
jgi:hypothetical protein